MFIVKCMECGREQEWKSGLSIITAQIQLAGDTAICDCGHFVNVVQEVFAEGEVED